MFKNIHIVQQTTNGIRQYRIIGLKTFLVNATTRRNYQKKAKKLITPKTRSLYLKMLIKKI